MTPELTADFEARRIFRSKSAATTAARKFADRPDMLDVRYEVRSDDASGFYVALFTASGDGWLAL